MTTALLVYAHADDEIIFGYPFLSSDDIDCKLLICANDSRNLARSWCSRQEEAFYAVCKQAGVKEGRILDFSSEFSRLPSRSDTKPLLKDWWNAATEAVVEMAKGCDFIATHNPWGEYGHLDHLLVRRMVYESGVQLPIRCTNGTYRTKTWPIGAPRLGHRWVLRDTPVHLDQPWYDALKEEYTKRGCFTWDNPVPSPVYIMDEV